MKSRVIFLTDKLTPGSLGDQLPHGNELRLAPRQASDFLERRLLFRTQQVRIFSILIEPGMSTAKFVTSRVRRNEAKVLVKLIPDAATQGGHAFRHRKPEYAILYRGIRCHIELVQGSVQIAPRKQQA